MLGYIFAIISSFFFSLYVVPRKLSKLPPLQFSQLMATGFFLSTIAAYLISRLLGVHEHFSATLLWSVVAGIIWATAFVTFVRSIDIVGLACSNQWKNLQGPTAVILSLVILSEYKITRPLPVLIAGAAIAVSAWCFTIAASKQQAKDNPRGVYLAILSGLGFGTVAVIQKYVTSHAGVYNQQVIWSFSILMSLVAYGLLCHTRYQKPTVKERQLAMGAGVLYLGASFFQLQAYRYLAASIVFILIQLNTVWTISIGIFYFKEIPAKRYYKRLLLGMAFALAGIVSLAFARK